MKEGHVARRLTAIMAMDVAGYSRLMGLDEEGTLARLMAHRKELIDPRILEHYGRIVKTMGDGLLVEFVSAVDAVRCAVDVQRGMAERNVDVPPDHRIQFRIGVNVGDIIVDEDEDIYGDGVNVAARLEALAEPGGICVSRVVADHVQDKLSFAFQDMGERRVKNIARPVRVLRVLLDLDAAPATTVPAAPPVAASRRRIWLGAGVAGIVLVIVAIAGPMLWRLAPPHGPARVASVNEATTGSYPGGPSLAVLPFANLSGEPDQDHLSEGLTEDVVTELAKVSGLRLVSGNATTGYKGKPVDMERIGRQLGVRYVLEGSTREIEGQLRVTAQLINADDRNHLWAYRYDGPGDQLAQTLDDVTEDITTQLVVQMRHADLELAKLKTPDALEPYDYYLLGKAHLARDDLAGLPEARALFAKAVAADASFAYGYGALADVDFRDDYLRPGSQDGKGSLDGVFAAAQRGLSMDTRVSDAYHALASVYLFRHQHDEAIKLLEKVIEKTADDADLKDLLGVVYTFAGDPQRGVEATERIMRLNPYYREGIFANLARSYVLTGRLDDAITQAEVCIARAPEFRPCYEAAAVAYAEKGMDTKSRAAVDQIRRLDPTFTLVTAPRALPFKKGADLDRFLTSLRKAGLE